MLFIKSNYAMPQQLMILIYSCLVQHLRILNYFNSKLERQNNSNIIDIKKVRMDYNPQFTQIETSYYLWFFNASNIIWLSILMPNPKYMMKLISQVALHHIDGICSLVNQEITNQNSCLLWHMLTQNCLVAKFK
ncbi:unnamed protein product [Paramecium primaurelia]|uniref:Uncharacterized protein n=1 Tax=Paramecium primaurelia TaxID=5886 RepID=A0A8S1QTA0_PARPR|nr:unnamed protein product [Paramecium primaurelia]